MGGMRVTPPWKWSFRLPRQATCTRHQPPRLCVARPGPVPRSFPSSPTLPAATCPPWRPPPRHPPLPCPSCRLHPPPPSAHPPLCCRRPCPHPPRKRCPLPARALPPWTLMRTSSWMAGPPPPPRPPFHTRISLTMHQKRRCKKWRKAATSMQACCGTCGSCLSTIAETCVPVIKHKCCMRKSTRPATHAGCQVSSPVICAMVGSETFIFTSFFLVGLHVKGKKHCFMLRKCQ
mmetsp:Transcript_17500/g.44585  ORF Transcript_17500/g.44585 Transcript_17500/m.44585 type:complete len:233 (-) Transcript_17500:25-723(-)